MKRTMRRRLVMQRPRRGVFLTDMIVGMTIMLLLGAVLASAAIRRNKGAEQLADSRHATRIAEQALTALQLGQTSPTPPEGATIEIVPIDGVKDVPSGYKWVAVRVLHKNRTANLTGLVRADAKGGTP